MDDMKKQIKENTIPLSPEHKLTVHENATVLAFGTNIDLDDQRFKEQLDVCRLKLTVDK